jgi:hypothetical protein
MAGTYALVVLPEIITVWVVVVEGGWRLLWMHCIAISRSVSCGTGTLCLLFWICISILLSAVNVIFCPVMSFRIETGCTPVLLPHMSMGWPLGGPKHDQAWWSTYGKKFLARIRPIWSGYPVPCTAHEQNFEPAKSVLPGLQGTKQRAHVGPKTEVKGWVDEADTEFHGAEAEDGQRAQIKPRLRADTNTIPFPSKEKILRTRSHQNTKSF